ncbi:hypothetical protein Q9295_13650 [Xinfangfangia sp. CPCC 101601]|uniref:Uncharacterized protein n=1 Tax=Pseudogemmobacter lacusdianii TaxID=3069608 RepID=A0ABU0W0K0_9RHOB|nr:hypothetical protein [Xinfangfangia sp. CPCC 101601]MDQ2067418.1 hypothetical protein [Xinfangfangia sp. CPCC 101601]
MSDKRPADPQTPPPLPAEAMPPPPPREVPPPLPPELPPLPPREVPPPPGAQLSHPHSPPPTYSAEPPSVPDVPPVYLPEPPRPAPQRVEFPPAEVPLIKGQLSRGRGTQQRFGPKGAKRKRGMPMWFILACVFALFLIAAEIESFWAFLIAIGVFIYLTRRNRQRRD